MIQIFPTPSNVPGIFLLIIVQFTKSPVLNIVHIKRGIFAIIKYRSNKNIFLSNILKFAL